MPAREVFKLIYKVGMIAVTLTLIGLAFPAYRSATPGNGLLLICGILGMLALIAGLSISKLDDQDRQAETYRGILDDVRKLANVSVRIAEPGREAGSEIPEETARIEGARVSFAEPEVHHVDGTMLDTARRMASEGAPIDDICRSVDPEHDRNDPMHQEAFRRIVRAMVDQA